MTSWSLKPMDINKCSISSRETLRQAALLHPPSVCGSFWLSTEKLLCKISIRFLQHLSESEQSTALCMSQLTLIKLTLASSCLGLLFKITARSYKLLIQYSLHGRPSLPYCCCPKVLKIALQSHVFQTHTC